MALGKHILIQSFKCELIKNDANWNIIKIFLGEMYSMKSVEIFYVRKISLIVNNWGLYPKFTI